MLVTLTADQPTGEGHNAGVSVATPASSCRPRRPAPRPKRSRPLRARPAGARAHRRGGRPRARARPDRAATCAADHGHVGAPGARPSRPDPPNAAVRAPTGRAGGTPAGRACPAPRRSHRRRRHRPRRRRPGPRR
ncbi:hypothetical protein I550_5225 [Mycobacterium intracellulare 1956]|uniref:Uncharacterized protein n=1 Tax=Mycobacterium intracellulare 1956 TaxID=1299331 RepID=X8CB66_MYCIT|nr:hypothetical protein I550_5225 [Mycobacterium intracellulare 1956]